MSAITGLSGNFVGNFVNQTTRYYWVQAIYELGRSPITGPVIMSGPGALDFNNYNAIRWNIVPGAIAYDVIVTTTSAAPTGTLVNGGVAIGIGVNYAKDTGNNVSWTKTNASITNISTTDDIPEGAVNLYYEDSRVATFIQNFIDLNNEAKLNGTAYTLTATPTAVTSSIGNPSITFLSAGYYFILMRARIDKVGATFSANRTATVKLRRTNNTAADLPFGSAQVQTGTPTTDTGTLHTLSAFCNYHATAGDTLTIFGDVSVVPDAGSVTLPEAGILAVRIG